MFKLNELDFNNAFTCIHNLRKSIALFGLLYPTATLTCLEKAQIGINTLILEAYKQDEYKNNSKVESISLQGVYSLPVCRIAQAEALTAAVDNAHRFRFALSALDEALSPLALSFNALFVLQQLQDYCKKSQ